MRQESPLAKDIMTTASTNMTKAVSPPDNDNFGLDRGLGSGRY
jgi:hypothetical protein